MKHSASFSLLGTAALGLILAMGAGSGCSSETGPGGFVPGPDAPAVAVDPGKPQAGVVDRPQDAPAADR
jgi:hypothetical protein